MAIQTVIEDTAPKGGEHPKMVQEMVSHANINITLDTSSQMLPDIQDKAVDRLGALLS